MTVSPVEANVLGRKKQAPIDKIETVIGLNTNFKGRLVCDGSVRIDGICEEGVIETVGNIVVGPQAKVAANLIADNISVSGAVTGSIKALGRLEILSTGKVWGDVDAGSFLLDNEAHFQGKLLTQGKLAPPEIGSAKDDTETTTKGVSEDESSP